MAEVGDVRIREEAHGSGEPCRAILAQLPGWFGIPESVSEYVETCDRTPTLIASVGVDDVGVLNLRRHGPRAAEVWVMAVAPHRHRQGIGRTLLEHAESALARDGCEFLQVKTLSSTRPDEGYARTRAFYLACGFVVLDELPNLWGEANPAVQLIKSVSPHLA